MIKTIDDINIECEEGKLLLAAIALLQHQYPTKSIEDIIRRLNNDFLFVQAKFN